MKKVDLTLEKVKPKNLEERVINGKKINDWFISDERYNSEKIVYGFSRCLFGYLGKSTKY